MDDQQLTMLDFFGGTADSAFRRRLGKVFNSGQVQSLRDEITRSVTAVGWREATAEMTERVDELLRTPFSEIFIKVWNEAGILNKYLNREKYDPTAEFLIELTKHTVKSEHQPYLEISLYGNPVGRITLEIDLALTLEGIVLKVQDAKVKEIRTGTCKGSGEVSCGGLVLARKKSKTLTLPFKLDLGEGIPIAP